MRALEGKAKTLMADFPSIGDAYDEFLDAWKPMADAYTDLVKPIFGEGKQHDFGGMLSGMFGTIPPGFADELAATAPERPLTAAASLRGSAEAYDTLIKASMQQPSKPEVETARNTGLSAASLAKIETALILSEAGMRNPSWRGDTTIDAAWQKANKTKDETAKNTELSAESLKKIETALILSQAGMRNPSWRVATIMGI